MVPDLDLRKETLFGNRVVTCFANRPATVEVMFRQAVQKFGARKAVSFEDEQLTYRELDASLMSLGLPQGARVALFLGNEPAFLISVLGVMRAGLVVVPMNVRQSVRETEFILNKCKASVIVCDNDLAGNIPGPEVTPTVHKVIYTGVPDSPAQSFDAFLRAAPGNPTFPDLHPQDCLCLLYTSGTTGRPKGAKLTHVGIVHSLMAFHRAYDLNEQDVSILAVPGSHATGLLAILLPLVTCGGCCVFLKSFKARTFLELAERERMSFTLMVPAMYNLCLLDAELEKFDLSNWRVAGFGGAPMPPSTIKKMAKVIPTAELSNVYGATETSSPTTIQPLGKFQDHMDAVGRPVACADVSLVDTKGKSLAAGEIGEIMIGGPMVIPGYWNNPKADQSEFDAAGRWRSGDLGFFSADGYLHISDRLKDIVNRGGYKIYCIEVEAVLTRHSDVLEVALVAVPDTVLGEKSHAHIYSDGADIDAGELTDLCAGLLSSYKVPDQICVSETPLPRNANGKILKTELRSLNVAASAAQ